MVVCLICGAHTSSDDRFCHSCGARLHECGNCGFVNRVGDVYCAKCGEYLEPQSPEPVLSEDSEPPPPPSGIGAAAVPWGVAAVLLALAAVMAAFVGIGSPSRSGNIPKGTLLIEGVDPAGARPVAVDLATPIRIEGALPPGTRGADSVKLGFQSAGVELGAASVPITVQPDGRFVTFFRTTGGGRYLIAGDTTGEVSMIQGATTLMHQSFDARLDNRSLLTIPLLVTIVGLYSLFWRFTSLLRSLRRGRLRRSGPARSAFLGALAGVALVLIAWIVDVREPTVPALVLSAVFGAAAGFSAAMSALAIGERRRWKARTESGNSPQSSQAETVGAPAPVPGHK